MCTRVLICSTEFAPPTEVEQIRKFAPGCIFIKHRLHDQNTPKVQIYTPGVYLHQGVYCAYERGFSDCCVALLLENVSQRRGAGVQIV